VKTESIGSGGVGKMSTTTIKYLISTRKQLQADRWISFVVKRTGKSRLGGRKPHVRFEVAGDGKVLWRA
jgi:hypothetical protein